MRSTIDSAGRIVIPRAVREELGWRGGEEVEIDVIDGVVEIAPVATKVTLVESEVGLTAIPEVELPPLTAEAVRRVTDATRR